MEQEESVAFRRRSVASIQARDSLGGGAEKLVVIRRILGGGVRPVREQREAEIAVRARQVMHLEALDLLLDLRWRRQERRHDDHRAQARRHSVAKLQAGRVFGAEPICDAAVHQRHRRIRCRNQGEQREQEEHPSADAELRHAEQRQGEDEAR